MNSQNQPVAAFRTAANTHIYIRVVADGEYDATCPGCGWIQTSIGAARGARGIIGRPDPLAALKADANAHALGCAEVPRENWPGDQTLGRR